MPFPSFTKAYHRKPYPAISPTRPELSAEGRVVLITGAGSGIGAATALAFAQAKAKTIIICGRRTSALEETKRHIEAQNLKSEIVVKQLDVADHSQCQATVKDINNKYGYIDILVHAAGHLSDAASLKQTSLDNFWTSFEVNVRGSFSISQAYLNQTASPSSSNHERILILVNSLLAHFAAPDCQTAPASYSICKLAQAKLAEFIASENDSDKSFRTYAVHPGAIPTDMSDKSVSMGPEGTRDAVDWENVNTPAHFFVWLASGEGRCIPSGRYLWAEWDVDELKARSEEFSDDKFLLTQTMKGWPFQMPEQIDP